MEIIEDQPHLLVIPYPAQGHVMPLVKLSCCLAERGFKITFVAAESIHDRLKDSALPKERNELGGIHLVSLPDGLTDEERTRASFVVNAMNTKLPAELENLIKIIQSSENGQISCVIADSTLGWALEVARKMGLRNASFFTGSAATLAITDHIPKLIEMGVIDENGTPKKKDEIMWSPTMPAIKPAHLVWHCMGGLISPELIFHTMKKGNELSKSANWLICNTSDELEHEAIALVPNLLTVGPLLASNQLGNFWPEDLSCLSWLDEQAAGSVVYIAFGSVAMLNQRQFHELALGLEILGRPFLWVVRSGVDLYGRPITTYPDGFQDRVAHLGKIVPWAPQRRVLAHTSLACFVTHCGWNSITEGVSIGVPFICWPYFADQFSNETYVTETWKVGLGLSPDKYGIISSDEIKRKVNQLLGEMEIRENSSKLKEMTTNSVCKGGSSWKNLERFVEELKSWKL